MKNDDSEKVGRPQVAPHKQTYKTKICLQCGQEYLPAGGRQQYCKKCIPMVSRAKKEAGRKRRLANHPEEIKAKQSISQAKWRATHKTDILAYKKIYHAAHPQENVARCARYWTTHREKLLIQNAIYRANHREEALTYARVYCAAHHEEISTYKKVWFKGHQKEALALTRVWRAEHPERMSAIGRKRNAKRRTLGFTPLNVPFLGCEGHHINQNDVIYIPRALHRSLRHNHWTGQGMQQINAAAYQYLAQASQ